MAKPPKKTTPEMAEKRARVEKAMRIYEGALESHEKDHPHWKAEALLGLIEWSLRSLRHYLEDVRDREITWAEPFVELPYAVEWDWNASREQGEQHGTILYGQITDQNVADQEKLLATLSGIMARQITAVALGDLTNWVRFADRGGVRRCWLPEETEKVLQTIKSRPRREAAFEEIIRPFSIGAGLVDYNDMEMRDGEPVSPTVAKQLAKLHEQIDIPDFGFTGEVNGRKLRFRLIFQIHPLITDHDNERAWHPITVGLFFEPEGSGKRLSFPNPGRWPRKVRAEFWEALFEALSECAKTLVPKKEIEQSVIIDFHAQLKVPAEHWSPQSLGDLLKRMGDFLSQEGEVTQLNASTQDARKLPPPSACPTCGWIHDQAFMEIDVPGHPPISIGGALAAIVGCVHGAHENGRAAISTKDDELLKACGGYFHPSKAFYDLGQRDAYRALFDTSRRGFIALHGYANRRNEA